MDKLPIPPAELMHRVAGDTDPDRFLHHGRRSALQIEQALAGIGRTFESFSSALDWGCGCGRMIRWFSDRADQVKLHGVDIDRHAIEWCQQNLCFASFAICEPEPPLDFADGSFDLVFNHSVLTHLNEKHQDLWLDELHRVTRPGGIVILSVHGDHAFAVTERNEIAGGNDPSHWRATLEQNGILFVEDDSNIGGPFPNFYHSTFHASWYVLTRWARRFAIRAYLPRADLEFQDIVVLERPADDSAITPPIEAATTPGRLAPVGPPPAATPSEALGAAHALVARGTDVEGPSRFGPAGRLARRAVLRLTMRSQHHQQRVDEAMLDAIRATSKTRVEGLVRSVLHEQGERMNRLEEWTRDELQALRVEIARENRGQDPR